MDIYKDQFNPSFLNENKQKIISPLPKNASVTMAYIPFQQEAKPYDEELKALKNGTLFPELNKPFILNKKLSLEENKIE